ncbi:TPA: GNAT family N-acetyltransferase [Methanosarcina acetivorans]|uniref:Acetyltransferase (GNAT) family protein n=2 Tax=Methanosarcina acetivorans TaxID=2214 RepID=Q8TU75_METAC|nr:GNAT family N-acetyltransferase [Methanosarcina acetivorans]AAM03651.1 acetyltransferase (GNAT) family protein [Methanosarcina acetivorans C2A]HIH95347.1 GNAT family N-acetyltransferase [Methanosarcina acetivorans]
MISIRPFNEADNKSMLEIERLCPQGEETCALGVDKKDIIARYKMYDNWNVLVAEVDGKIAGWIGLTVKPTHGREEKYAYLPEVMVHPAFRKKGVATKLVEEAEKRQGKWKQIMPMDTYTNQIPPLNSYSISLGILR